MIVEDDFPTDILVINDQRHLYTKHDNSILILLLLFRHCCQIMTMPQKKHQKNVLPLMPALNFLVLDGWISFIVVIVIGINAIS